MSGKLYIRADEVVLRSIAGEDFLIVLHAGESKMYSLNGMGLWFWTQLERPVTRQELLAAMLAEYDVAEDVAAAEVERFLEYLVERGLAVVRA
ncbi:MAG: PqqD family protein [Kiritimatiellae bacterium]|nr:PqqD family protein [Kiritimatiellia bacterium]